MKRRAWRHLPGRPTSYEVVYLVLGVWGLVRHDWPVYVLSFVTVSVWLAAEWLFEGIRRLVAETAVRAAFESVAELIREADKR